MRILRESVKSNYYKALNFMQQQFAFELFAI